MTTGITFGCANLISTLATVKGGFVPTPPKIIGIYAGLLISHGLVNTFGVHILKYLNNSSIILQSAGISALAIAVVAAAPTHQSAKFVCRCACMVRPLRSLLTRVYLVATFYDGTGESGSPGWSVRASPEYVACIGILMSQYTITGFDASAHLSEEVSRLYTDHPKADERRYTNSQDRG